MLDGWLNAARAHGVDVMYTFSRTPDWAAASSHEACGPRRDSADCALPADLMTTAACQGPLGGRDDDGLPIQGVRYQYARSRLHWHRSEQELPHRCVLLLE